MQWSYEGKKLDATVKHLSTRPPWVCVAEGKDAPLGRRFLGGNWGEAPDEVGLGRHPSFWGTLNCKYNSAFDV